MWFKDGQVYNSVNAIRAVLANVSLPAVTDEEVFAEFGFKKVVDAERPEITENQFIESGEVVELNGELIRQWNVIDKSPEEVQASVNAKALAYLAETDWYVVRFAETGTEIPEDIKVARANARASIIAQ